MGGSTGRELVWHYIQKSSPYEDPVTVTELCNAVDMDRRVAYEILKELREEGLIDFVKKGKGRTNYWYDVGMR